MKKLLLIVLLIVGCDKYAPTEHTHEDTVEVDWILIKSSNAVKDRPDTVEKVYGIGYMLFITNSAGFTVDESILDNNVGILSFIYNEESFNFDLSNSYNEEVNRHFFIVYDYDDVYPNRLILNKESNDLSFYSSWGYGGEVTTAQPNEIIEYR